MVTQVSPLTAGGSTMLTDAQLDHIRERLLEERKRALGEITRSQADAAEGELESTGDLSALTDNADRGTQTEDEELAATLAEREIAEVSEIDAALERLYKHPRDFGRCERTGKDIPLARLELIPWARTC
jgi:RNA polymerase-binding transcription factor DksA